MINRRKNVENIQYWDLKHKIQNKYINVHKIIIETNFKYFETKFTESTGAMRESTKNKAKDSVINNRILILAIDYKEEEIEFKCVDIIKNNMI